MDNGVRLPIYALNFREYLYIRRYIPSSLLLHRTTTSRKHFDVVYCTHSSQLYAVRCGFHFNASYCTQTRLYLRIYVISGGAATRLSSSLHYSQSIGAHDMSAYYYNSYSGWKMRPGVYSRSLSIIFGIFYMHK